MVQTKLCDRIALAIRKSGLTQSQIAQKVGVKPPSVASWLNGKTKELLSTVALDLARTCGVSFVWLVRGEGKMDATEQRVQVVEDDDPHLGKDGVSIKFYRVKCSAGNGLEPTYEEINDSDAAYYKLSWFTKRGIDPKNCVRMPVEGDSMEPTLYDGDCILVDTGDCLRIENNRIYVINVDDGVRVKRLIKQLNGDIIIKSDNPNYPTEVLNHNDDIPFKVLGRVIEKAGTGGL